MAYSTKRLRANFAFEQALRRLMANASLTDADLARITAGVFDGRSIGLNAYCAIQTRLRASAPVTAVAKKAVDGFLAKGYEHYLLSMQLRAMARVLRVPYKIDHIPKTTANNRRPASAMRPLYLTIHSTGNPSSKASGERSYLTNLQNTRTASFHVVVDESQVVECIPFDEVAWHAGDGNGDGNKKSISMEICESGDREVTLKNAALLAASILRDKGWDVLQLRRHHDWATKLCPRILIVPESRHLPEQTWEWFESEVENLL